MTANDYQAKCLEKRGGVTESEAAIIASLLEMEKRADMYADICRGVAEALGLPAEGEGSSWSDLPREVRIAVFFHRAPTAPDGLRMLAQEVWDSVPADYSGSIVQRHAKALNALGAALAKPALLTAKGAEPEKEKRK